MVAPLGLPVMLGLIPLKSFKMANYLHTKVPGISLTDDILKRMELGGKEAGLEIALETLLEIKKSLMVFILCLLMTFRQCSI